MMKGFLGYSSRRRTYRSFNSRAGMIMESINVVIDDSNTEQRMDVEDNVGTSFMHIDETLREEMYKLTSIESGSSKANKGLPTEGQIEQSKELITRLPNKEDITESNKKISNDDECYALRSSLFFWINKKQSCASWCTAEAEFRESFSKLMLKEYDVK